MKFPIGVGRRICSYTGKLVLALLASLVAMSATAADWPTRPISLVVPFSPGGGTDVIARILGQKLSEKLGGDGIVILNKPGAGGTIGAAYVAKARPDGYTLLLFHIAMVTTPYIQKVPYDPIKDFTPIGLVGAATNTVAVNAKLPIKTFADLIALAQKKPGALNFGTSGVGGADYLGGEILQSATGIQLTHVPYKGGAPAVAAASAGEIEMTTGSIAMTSPGIQGGHLRPLVVMQRQRNAVLPNVPSAAEAGYPNLDYKTWFGLWGPSGMAPGVVEKVNTALKEILKTPEVQQALRNQGIEAEFNTPQEFSTMIKSEYNKWGKVLAGKFKP